MRIKRSEIRMTTSVTNLASVTKSKLIQTTKKKTDL
jgi:hypothetical protein